MPPGAAFSAATAAAVLLAVKAASLSEVVSAIEAEAH